MVPAASRASAPFSTEVQLIFATRKIKDTFSEDSGRLPADDMERLLSFRRNAQMLDRRDYIFSLLGLFSPSVSTALSPNYSMSFKDLLTAVAKYIIDVSGDLRILCSVEIPKHIEGDTFPSWVPDWIVSSHSESVHNVLRYRNFRSRYRATRESRLDRDTSSDSTKLQIDGIRIGTVIQVGKYNDFHTISDFKLDNRYEYTQQPITAALRQAQTLDIDVASGKIPSGHSQRRSLEAFYDVPSDPNVPASVCNQCPITHTMPYLSIPDAVINPELDDITRPCGYNAMSQNLFTTSSGYFGFGPTCTAVADQVFLLIGSDVPLVLRSSGEEVGLVGPCCTWNNVRKRSAL